MADEKTPKKPGLLKRIRNAQTPRESRWHRLDNTANLFPVITSKKESNVYRLAVNLTEEVDAETLQKALEEVLPRFAALRVRLRKGLFWHYLEANPGMPTVQPEDDYPLRSIEPRQNNYFLFRVTYFEKRINLEVFHVLTDGTGGFQFLLALTCRYLLMMYPDRFSDEDKARQWFAQHAQNTEDSYAENYTPTKKSTYGIGKGYRIRGERSILDNVSVVHAYTPVKPLLDFCRARDVTISQYIAAVLAWAVYTRQLKKRPTKHPVNIFVPVNLRPMFASTTALNFFSNIYISLPLHAPNLTFEEVLAETKKQFDEKLSRDAMLEKISYTVGSGYSPFIRAVPLVIKKLVLKAIFLQSAKSSTLSLSNVGKVSLPAPFAPYVTGAHVLLSVVQREPLKCATLSYGDTFTLSLTSILKSMDLQRAVICKLAADGLDITVESNGVDYESL